MRKFKLDPKTGLISHELNEKTGEWFPVINGSPAPSDVKESRREIIESAPIPVETQRLYVTEPDPGKKRLAESFMRAFGVSQAAANIAAGIPNDELAKAIVENKDLSFPDLWDLLTERK